MPLGQLCTDTGVSNEKYLKEVNFKLLDELFPIYEFSSLDFFALYLGGRSKEGNSRLRYKISRVIIGKFPE